MAETIRDGGRRVSTGSQNSGFQVALEERHLEPDLEHQEQRHADNDADGEAAQPCVLAEPDHEHARCRASMRRRCRSAARTARRLPPGAAPQTPAAAAPTRRTAAHLGDGTRELPVPLPPHERDPGERRDARQAEQRPDVERKIARLRTVVAPARAQPSGCRTRPVRRTANRTTATAMSIVRVEIPAFGAGPVVVAHRAARRFVVARTARAPRRRESPRGARQLQLQCHGLARKPASLHQLDVRLLGGCSTHSA